LLFNQYSQFKQRLYTAIKILLVYFQFSPQLLNRVSLLGIEAQ